jgi:hypothetical protein
MGQLGNVAEINEVKRRLDSFKEKGLLQSWELPYEETLTRLSAAIFFLTPSEGAATDEVWKAIGADHPLQNRPNEEKTLSLLDWRVEFPPMASMPG